MRLSLISLIIVIATASIFAQKYVTPKEEIGLYQNETRQVYEEPVQTVTPNDRLTIIETKNRHFKVKTGTGVEGWVEKRLVAATGKSKTFVFDNAEVIGYLDNPTPVYIIDTDDPNADPINLDRSFKDALRENVDKETIERQVK
jgi:hypothetical protein